VFREHWREREFWAWWWQTRAARQLAHAAGAAASFAVLAGVGVFVAIRVSSAESSTTKTIVWQTITVEKSGSGARVNAPPRVRTVVRYVTRKRVVTKPAALTRTVVQPRTVTHATSSVVTRTVTRFRLRRVTETVAHLVTVTTPPVTATQTLPAETVFVTVTVKHGH
jgi:hypothetical protein